MHRVWISRHLVDVKFHWRLFCLVRETQRARVGEEETQCVLSAILPDAQIYHLHLLHSLFSYSLQVVQEPL